jgi:hypothetical protein
MTENKPAISNYSSELNNESEEEKFGIEQKRNLLDVKKAKELNFTSLSYLALDKFSKYLPEDYICNRTS